MAGTYAPLSLSDHLYSGDGGPATSARLNTPTGIAIDAKGNIFIADNMNNVIRMVRRS